MALSGEVLNQLIAYNNKIYDKTLFIPMERTIATIP